MNTSVKEFPFGNVKASDLPKSDMKTALEWKEALEKEIKERLQEPLIKSSILNNNFFKSAIQMGQHDVLRELLSSQFKEEKKA